MPENFVMQHDSDMLIITGVQDLLWQKQVQWISHHLWTFSSPCQSWSSAAKQDGLMSIHGQCLVHTICQAKGFQPAFLGIEQVAGFQQHPQFKFLLNLIRWAGYEMVFERVCDMSDISPVKRHRWPALFVHKDARNIRQEPQPWPKAPVAPRDFDALHLHDDSARHAFEPSFQIASTYFSEDFMPKWRNHWTKPRLILLRFGCQSWMLYFRLSWNSMAIHATSRKVFWGRTDYLVSSSNMMNRSVFLHRMRSWNCTCNMTQPPCWSQPPLLGGL